MNNLSTLILSNTTNKNPINLSSLKNAELASTYSKAITRLQYATSQIVTASINKNHSEQKLQEYKNGFFNAYKILLELVKLNDEKFLKADATDLQAISAFIGTFKKQGSTKNLVLTSEKTFRKNIESFFANRIQNNICKTAEEVETERIAKREAKKARIKAEKETKKQNKKVKEVA